MENNADTEKHKIRKFNPRTIIAFVAACIAAVLLMVDDGLGKKEKTYRFTEGFVFGTTYHITYASFDDENLDAKIKSALEAVDNSLSMFNPNSIIAQINTAETAVIPDALFLKVWHQGAEISRMTDGAFDMTVAPLVDLWGFGLENRQSVTSEMVDSVKQYTGWNNIALADGRIVKQDIRMRIDAGAIAKGFACDVVLDTLLAYGCTDACVEIGGEVAVVGVSSKGKSWRIGINTPIEDSLSVVNEVQTVISLNSGGMATSGNYRNFYVDGGKKYSHTINPFTGCPVQHNLLSASIVTDECMPADAWATACMVVGLEQAKAWITEHNELEGYLIYEEDGEMKVWYSAGFPIDK